MDIVQKLSNWIMYCTKGQAAVLSEARDEILRLRKLVEELSDVIG